jgi:hypothetical protein
MVDKYPERIRNSQGDWVDTTEVTYSDLRVDQQDLFTGIHLLQGGYGPFGPHTMQVWYGDRLLVEKTFTIVPPAERRVAP